MSALGSRGAELKDMQADGRGRVRLDYMIPSRGLIGFQTEFRTMTRGTGLLHHVFDHYGPVVPRELGQRPQGVLIANGQGAALAYSLFSLQERGRLCIGPGEEVYEGMIIGLHNRDNDLVVNPLKGKKLTNMRAAGKDENVVLTPAHPLLPGAGDGVHRRRRAHRSHAGRPFVCASATCAKPTASVPSERPPTRADRRGPGSPAPGFRA